jgi:hypothetical protein
MYRELRHLAPEGCTARIHSRLGAARRYQPRYGLATISNRNLTALSDLLDQCSKVLSRFTYTSVLHGIIVLHVARERKVHLARTPARGKDQRGEGGGINTGVCQSIPALVPAILTGTMTWVSPLYMRPALSSPVLDDAMTPPPTTSESGSTARR